MAPEQWMIVFCCLFIGAMLLLVLVPFLLGRSDLLTTWNIFLIGSANFVGASGIASAMMEKHYVDYADSDYVYFFLGVVTFYTTLVITYYRWKLPRRIAGKTLRKWPPGTNGVLFFMLILSLVFAVASVSRIPVQFVAQIIAMTGNKSIPFALAIAFVAWYRQKINPVLIITLVATVLVSIVLAFYAGTGRRSFIGVIMAIPFCIYWLILRYKSVKLNMTLATIGVVLFTLVIGADTAIRHRGDRGRTDRLGFAIETLRLLPSKMFSFDIKELAGQNAVECSLLSIHMYTRTLKPYPFHTLIFVAVNPLPRAFWPDKPIGLGKTLPHDWSKYFGGRWIRATWGPGIVGHGFYEGGLHMLIFYGVLFAAVFRFLDELLMRQANNPYILGALASVCGHIFGLSRGDIGTFSLHIIAGIVMVIFMGWAGRIVFGTGMKYPRTDRLNIRKHGVFEVIQA